MKIKSHEDKLKPLLTDEFLETLRLSAKTCGWSVDHVATKDFVSWCFDIAGKEKPEIEPFSEDTKE